MTTRALVPAVAAALLALTLSGCGGNPVAIVTATPTPTPTPAPVEEPVKEDVPADPTSGYTLLVDNDGILSIEVPDAWTDVTTAPNPPFQVIAASTDLAAFDEGALGTFDTPGVSFIATQSETEGVDVYIQKFQEQFGPFCDAGESDVYDDGLYVGKYLYLPNCGIGSDFVGIVATDYDQTQTLLFTAVLVSDEDKTTTLDHLIQTFYSQY